MTLRVHAIEPATGATWGGNVVKVSGTDLGATPQILFHGIPAIVQLVESNACYVLAPKHGVGLVDVEVVNGKQKAKVIDGYRYARATLNAESDLTRIVRTLLRCIKANVLEQTSMTVDVAYGSHNADATATFAVAELPGIVVGGPDIQPNRLLSTNVAHEATNQDGHTFVYRTPYTADLLFAVTGAAEQKVDALNIMNAIVRYVHDVGTLAMLRNPEFPQLGYASWPLEFSKPPRTFADTAAGTKGFQCELRVKGFDVAGSHPNRLLPTAEGAHVTTHTKGATHA